MTTYSVIDIENLPETNNFSEEDKFYVISKREGDNYVKEEITINDLSAFFYNKDMVNAIQAKYDELLQLSSDFLSFLNENYPTKEYISATFSTLSHFNDVLNSVETKQSVISYFDEYATNLYNNYLKSNAKNECQKLKTEYQNNSSESILGQISLDDN